MIYSKKAICMALACCCLSGTAFAQNISLTLNNVTVKQAMDALKKQSGYSFVFSSEDVDTKKKVSVDADDQKVEEVVRQILDGQSVTYEIKGKNIVVRSIAQTSSSQQKKTITGTIVDPSGMPVIGANVMVKGTTNGTITDMDGKFSLEVASGATLMVSYIGFANQEIKIGNQTVLSITLKEDAEALDEVVVVGYGTQKKVNLTGAVSAVKSEELVVAPVANVTNTLAGRLSGVIARQSSGEPGKDGASINIRGLGGALVIVDGIESDINILDPNEIESVTVLKDASAAIYGARAGNGVILVTTKRGMTTKPTINLNSTFSFQNVTSFPKSLNAGQYAEIVREAQLNSGTPETGMQFTEEDVQKYKEGIEPGYEGSDWWNTILRKSAPMQVHNLSLSGGTDVVRYYTFLGYTDQRGMYKSGDNKYQRYNMRANVDGNINKNLTVSLDISNIITDLNSPSRDQNSLWGDIFGALPTLPSVLPDPTKIAWSGGITSPVAGTTNELGGYNKSLGNQLFTTISAKYKIPFIDGLSVKALFNYKQTTTENKSWGMSYDMYLYDATSDKYILKPSAHQTQSSESYNRSKTLTGQYSINYEKVFAERHAVSGMLLWEVMDSYNKWFSAGRSGYLTNAIDQIFAGSEEFQSANGSASESGRISYVGRFNYGFAEKYLFEATFRYDGSPNFPSDKRWGFFPSFSAGWRISEESFLKSAAPWIDNLKLRLSYSNTGYDAIGAFQYLTGYQFSTRYVVDGEVRNSLTSKGLANSNITWEEMTMYNAGIDFGIFNGLLYGEVDGFYRLRDNILGSRSVSMPNTFGATLPLENINSLSNRGFEIMLGHKNQIGDWSYDVSGNFSYSRAKWEHYDEPEYTDPDDIRMNKVSGNWANRFFGYESDGLFTSQEEIDNYPLDQDLQGNATLQPGDIKYVDQNGDNVLDWRDKVLIGRGADPEFMFGLNLNVQYKGFDLSALFQGAAHRDLHIYAGMQDMSNTNNTVYDNRWTEENNDKWAIVPRQYIGGKENNKHTSDYWLVNASYLRLKTLSLGYNFPKEWLSKVSIDQVRIYLAATNLFTISELMKYNVDPEGTGVASYYPQQKVFTVGLNLKF